MNLSPKVLLKKGFSDKKNLPKEVHQQYIAPFPNRNSRHALLKLAKALVGSSDWYQDQWERLEKLTGKEWLIIWGIDDSFITRDFLDKWTKRLPDYLLEGLNCGHFVQEEKTEESIKSIANFMKK